MAERPGPSEWNRFGALRTQRMRLDPQTFDHVDLLVDLDADPEVTRYVSGTSRNDCLQCCD